MTANNFDIASIPIDQLERMPLRVFDPESRSAVKARLAANRAEIYAEERERRLNALQPENMSKPFKVRITMWGDEPRFGSAEFMSNRIEGYRALRPGEVVCVDLDDPIVLKLFQKQVIELTNEPITRPMIYAESEECECTHPSRQPEMESREPEKMAALLSQIDDQARKLNASYQRIKAEQAEAKSNKTDSLTESMGGSVPDKETSSAVDEAAELAEATLEVQTSLNVQATSEGVKKRRPRK